MEDTTTHPQQPDQVWAGNISYIHTGDGFLYFETWLDVFTRKVVEYTMNGTMNKELILKAFHLAMGNQSIALGQLTMHSDRGAQYAWRRVSRDYETLRYQDEHVASRQLLGSLCS